MYRRLLLIGLTVGLAATYVSTKKVLADDEYCELVWPDAQVCITNYCYTLPGEPPGPSCNYHDDIGDCVCDLHIPD